ncbi:MAG: vWA domain-containing protein, partial [Hyphomicrobiaceae bacterium]
PRGETLYDWAKNNNIEIREDVVVEQMAAISQKLIDGTAGGGDRLKVGVMAFSETMQVLVRPTTDLTQLSDPVSRARLRRNSTLYNVVMPQITREVGNSGDGSSEGSPRKTLILITDGVYVDDRRNFLSREFNSRECNTLKSSGVNVIVVNVKYVEDRGNYLFEDLVAPFYDRIAPELTACASSGKYYEATDTDDIVATFDILANNILAGQIRLTH